MHDVETDSDAESASECLDCGNVVFTEGYPGACSSCGSPMRNRGTPLE